MPLTLRNRFQILATVDGQGESLTSNDGNQIMTSANQTSTLTKTYFKLIQAIHHAEILENANRTNNPPPGMTRQVFKLTDFVKPACPNTETRNKIKQNTDVWMKKTLHILLEHYDELIKEKLRGVERLDREVFEKAVGWAKSRYKKKLTNSSVERVLGLIEDRVRLRVNDLRGEGEVQTEIIEREEEVVIQGSGIVGTEERSIVHQQREVTLEVTEEKQNRLNDREDTELENGLLICDSFVENTPPSEIAQHLDKPVSGMEGEPMDDGSTESSMLDSPLTDFDEEDADLTYDSPGPLTLFEPTRHHLSQRKILEWSLIVNKDILFIGDSNLSRIPYFTQSEIQIDSYPGATLYHLCGILQKLKPKPRVKMVILSIGLNNCLQGNEITTTKKQTQQLHRICQTVFPSSTIFFPLINFSNNLKPQTKRLLESFNLILREKYNFLPKINDADFEVDPKDNIHWLSDTASEILNLWLKTLDIQRG